MTPPPHTVAIVEDDFELCATIRDLIEESAWSVTACFSNAEAALPALRASPPGVVLMDIQLPGMSGIELTRQLHTENEELRILMLTVYDNADRVFAAIAAGASGYLLKRDIPSRLTESMEEVLTGSTPISSAVARKVFQHFQQKIPEPTGQPEWNLTDREQQVLDGLVRGGLYKEIADELDISLETVRFHLRNIYKKLHVRTRTEAVVKYLGGNKPWGP